MSSYDEIRKTMGMPNPPAKDTWPRRVANNELPPPRRGVDPNYEPPQTRDGIRGMRIENAGRVVGVREQWEQRQQQSRLPDPARHIRDSREHNQFLCDGSLPAPTKADGTPEYKTVKQFSSNSRQPVGDND
jgi:hypothetical protein